MSNHEDKPWMRPTQYVDSQPVDSHRDEIPLEGDVDQVQHVRRSPGDRESVKPPHGSTDKTPMVYVPWHRRSGKPLDIDDEDELDG
jgi:hypothetical protein